MMALALQPSSVSMKGSQMLSLAVTGSGMLRSTASTLGSLLISRLAHPYQLHRSTMPAPLPGMMATFTIQN